MLGAVPALFFEIVKEHPGWFIGPLVAGLTAQALVGGIVLSQSLRFWSRSMNQHLLVKAIVIFVTFIAMCVRYLHLKHNN